MSDLSTDHVLAGDAPFADLLPGWCGPIEWRLYDEGPWRRGVWGYTGPSSLTEHMGVVGVGDLRPDPMVRLPLAREEVRHRLAVTLARGLRCHGEDHATCGRPTATGPCDAAPEHGGKCRTGNTRQACPGCRDGWVRRPDPVWHLVSAAEGGRLPDKYAAHAPRLLACSTRRVVAGLWPIVGLLGAWGWTTIEGGTWARPVLSKVGMEARGALGCVYRPVRPGFSETSMDTHHLGEGWALLDADGLRLPSETP